MPRLVRNIFSALGIGPAATDSDLEKVVDRRGAPRFQTELTLQWPGGTGVVLDISSTGVQFETNHPISPNEKIKFTIVMLDDEGRQSHHTLCDSEIKWIAPSRTKPHKLNVGASLTKFKSVSLPLAA